MEFRKLEREEYGKTREIWERIFTVDTQKFLDYYYSVKTEQNEMHVLEEAGNLVSMLHLNPYDVRVNDSIYRLHYIVAVATDERYRKRGFMGRLLRESMRVMYDRKEPFTFLMPAAEAIYYPHDFRFIYSRNQGQIFGENVDTEVEIFPLTEKDCGKLAAYANDRLKQYQVCTERNANYYQVLIAEQQSCNGNVLLIQKQGELAGSFCYGKEKENGEESIEVREPLFLEEQDFLKAIYLLTGSESKAVNCYDYGSEKKPIIMARILHLETFLKSLKPDKDVDIHVSLEDKIIKENNGVFHVVGNKKEGITLVEKIEDYAHEIEKISIGDFTKEVFEKYLPKVFLNEVV